MGGVAIRGSAAGAGAGDAESPVAWLADAVALWAAGALDESGAAVCWKAAAEAGVAGCCAG